MRIDLNADLGESFGAWTMGDDAAMLAIVTSANVACGFHAGDPATMRATAELARTNGVAIGAHPGFADLQNFGRRRVPGLTAREVENLVAYQTGAMQAMAALAGHPVTHVKTHGALANMCAENDDLALAVGRGIRSADPSLRFLVMPGAATERAADRLNLACFREIYADRTYDDDFNLTDRAKPGAVIHDPDAAIRHVLGMLEEGALRSVSGKRLKVGIDSICVHGDNPGAVTLARRLRARLEAQGVTVKPYNAPL
jgi:5-oxoprolinase (ATP-hydrolysing) subunit A